jgi:hypothetical protein
MEEVKERIWLARVPPHEVATRLGGSPHKTGPRTVMLVSGARYDATNSELRFEASNVEILNIGSSDAAVIVGYDPAPSVATQVAHDGLVLYGPGDRRFLTLIRSEMTTADAIETGERLLEGVRRRFPGDLDQLADKPRKFVERPDNFWTVMIQPREQNYYITVRGKPERYQGSSFEVKSEMGSYSRFYLRHTGEVEEAARLISKSHEPGSLARPRAATRRRNYIPTLDDL